VQLQKQTAAHRAPPSSIETAIRPAGYFIAFVTHSTVTLLL
jgi:hypothetical protein